MKAISRRDFLIDAVGATALVVTPGCALRRHEQRSGWTYDPVYLTHDTGPSHIEGAERLTAIVRRLKQTEQDAALTPIRPKKATIETVSLVHELAYIKTVEQHCQRGTRHLSTGDTALCKDSYDVALHAAGGVTAAVDAVARGRVPNAFCAVRPPGHHAGSDYGMGFCIFNNVAIAARYAQNAHGIDRVLIADWDVHHGNGTQDIFYEDGSVFYMSTHQSPWYPGTGRRDETGEGKGRGRTMNRPLPAGAGTRDLTGIFREEFLPAATRFKPDLTLISAGFDSRAGDPLGGFTVDDAGFRELTRIMVEIAHINGGGRLVSVLEGGYHLEGLALAASAHVDELSKAAADQ